MNPQCTLQLTVSPQVKQTVTFAIQSFLSGPIAKATLSSGHKTLTVPCLKMYQIQVTAHGKKGIETYHYVNPYGTRHLLFGNDQTKQTITFSDGSGSFQPDVHA